MTNILHLQSSFVFNKFPSHSLKVQVSMVASLKKQINDFAGIRVRQKKKRRKCFFVCHMGSPSLGRHQCKQPERGPETSKEEMGNPVANSFCEPGSAPTAPVQPLCTVGLTTGRCCTACSVTDWWEPRATRIPENHTGGLLALLSLNLRGFPKTKLLSY